MVDGSAKKESQDGEMGWVARGRRESDWRERERERETNGAVDQ